MTSLLMPFPRFGGACGEVRPRGMVVDPDEGTTYVVGNFTKWLDVCGLALATDGRPAAFIFKLDAGGSPLWAKK